ncbi:MAG: glycosyltransferase [Pirellulaceae bacterium]
MQSIDIIICPTGSAGDHFPFIGLGQALLARGHRVTMVSNGYFQETIEAAGLEYVELATRDEFLQLANDPDLWSPFRGFPCIFRGLWPYIPRQYEYLRERRSDKNFVVIASSLSFGARIAQESLRIPLVTVHLQPAVIWSEFQSPKFFGIWSGAWVPRWVRRWQYALGERLVIDRTACPDMNRFRSQLGLAPMRRLTSWWNSTDRIIGLFPPWYGPPQPDWPKQLRLTEFPLWEDAQDRPLGADVERFLAEGEAPIVFTPGSAMMFGKSFFVESARACQQLGRRGMLMTRFADQIPAELPAGVRHFEYAPFSRLLRRAAAVVHHGGIGTTAQALASGVPQLIMPMSHDQPDNAHRVSQLGVADWVSRRKYRATNIVPKLQRLLTSHEVATSCRDVAHRFAGVDPFAKACELCEQVARV